MLAIHRKLIRDLLQMKGQAVAIAAVIGCGIAVFIGAQNTLHSLSTAREIYYDRYRFAQVFTASTEAQIAWVEAHADTDLRRYGSPHPMLGMLDGVQWMILLAAHARRHAQQVREVRAQYAATGG